MSCRTLCGITTMLCIVSNAQRGVHVLCWKALHLFLRGTFQGTKKDWRISENLVHFSVYMKTVQYWQRIALCLDHLLKSRRNIKARKLVPVAASKNFSLSWELIGESHSVIKIDC